MLKIGLNYVILMILWYITNIYKFYICGSLKLNEKKRVVGSTYYLNFCFKYVKKIIYWIGLYLIHSIIPVSYTHLDVYKRQLQD